MISPEVQQKLDEMVRETGELKKRLLDLEREDRINRAHRVAFKTIASANAPGKTGECAIDANYFYRCYALNKWARWPATWYEVPS